MSFWNRVQNFLSGKHNDNSTIVVRDKNVPTQKSRADVMGDFSKILTSDAIRVDVDVSDRNEALKYLAEFAHDLNSKINSEAIYGKYLLREQEAGTDLGFEMAVPHAQDESIEKLTMIVIKTNKKIQWTASEKVDVIVSFLVPDPEPSYEHVMYLSSLARLIMKQQLNKKIKRAKTGDEILQLFIR